MPPAPVVVTAAVEGPTDEVALRRLCDVVGANLGTVYGRTGKSYVLRRAAGFNNSARFRHWVLLVDLDNDFRCAGEAVASWMPDPSALMCFRIAVRELEAWLLADWDTLAEYLMVSRDLFTVRPKDLENPKETLIDLARRSRSRAVREDMVPDPTAGQSVGPAYTARLIEFITNYWRPEVAAENSRSLTRCIEALKSLVSNPIPPAS